MRDARIAVNRWSARQRGLVTQMQLRSAGVTKQQWAALVDEGSLISAGRRTYRHAAAVLDDRTRLLAACLDSGGVAAVRSAAWLHGLPDLRGAGLPEVLLADPHGYRTPIARVHTTTWLPPEDVTQVDGIPCTSVARTLFGLAALVPEVPDTAVVDAVERAVRMGVASDKWLWWRLEKLRCRGRNRVAVFEAIMDARSSSPTESWLERELLRVLAAAGVPLPVCQARIQARGAFVARVDFLYEEPRVIIEVTGAVGHSTPMQRAADARRRNRLARLGFLVLEFTYEQVVGEPERVVAEVQAALRERKAA